MANTSIYNAFERLWTHVVAAIPTKFSQLENDMDLGKVDIATSTTPGSVLSGGDITVDASGAVTVKSASTSAAGKVQLSSATNSTSTSLAATASAVKAAYDLAASKTSNVGTITGVTAGNGLTGGGASGAVTVAVGAGAGITVTADAIKAKLLSETALTVDSAAATTTSGRVYPVALDKTGYLAVNVPWTNTTYTSMTAAEATTGTATTARSISAKVLNDKITEKLPTKVSQLSNDSGFTSNTGTITGVSANGTSVATSGVANIPAASTSAYGVTKLSSATNSTSTTLAATASAVKAAYDLANSKTANTGTVTSVATGTGLTGGPITTSGTISLATSGATAGTYGAASSPAHGGSFAIPSITVDTYGRVTKATTVNVTLPEATQTTYQGYATSNALYPLAFCATSGITSTSGRNAAISRNNAFYVNPSTGSLYATAVYGAVWNDYAEYREANSQEPGCVVCENGDDTLSLSTERLQPGANIISDTFGFAIGETDSAKTPIAVSGRVLAYPYEDRKIFAAGDAVCAGPGGTVSKMSREEIMMYPERIIGTVSAIPSYETWGQNNVSVNGRIWIKV